MGMGVVNELMKKNELERVATAEVEVQYKLHWKGGERQLRKDGEGSSRFVTEH